MTDDELTRAIEIYLEAEKHPPKFDDPPAPKPQPEGITLGFGKYAETPIKELPLNYALWVYANVGTLSGRQEEALASRLGKPPRYYYPESEKYLTAFLLRKDK
jgi:hypothetical protein